MEMTSSTHAAAASSAFSRVHVLLTVVQHQLQLQLHLPRQPHNDRHLDAAAAAVTVATRQVLHSWLPISIRLSFLLTFRQRSRLLRWLLHCFVLFCCISFYFVCFPCANFPATAAATCCPVSLIHCSCSCFNE